MTLLNTVRHLDPIILDLNNTQLTEILLYGEKNLDDMNNTSILDATINVKKKCNVVLLTIQVKFC